jgi:hypothetical protein
MTISAQKNSLATKQVLLRKGDKYGAADTTARPRSCEVTPDLAALNRLTIQRIDPFGASVIPGVPLN